MRRTRTRFSKDLGLRDSVLLGVGFIIGSGIFLFPIIMASMAGTYSLVSWVIGGVFTIVTGFCFAENASRIPKAGGLYSYAHQELGNTIGFLAGWSFWIGYWLTISTETAGPIVQLLSTMAPEKKKAVREEMIQTLRGMFPSYIPRITIRYSLPT